MPKRFMQQCGSIGVLRFFPVKNTSDSSQVSHRQFRVVGKLLYHLLGDSIIRDPQLLTGRLHVVLELTCPLQVVEVVEGLSNGLTDYNDSVAGKECNSLVSESLADPVAG